MNSAEIHETVLNAINNETIISDECARAIAYNWMAPNTCMSAFAHGFQVRVLDFWTEAYRELKDPANNNGAPLWDLMALIEYIESAEMNREMRANREDEQ